MMYKIVGVGTAGMTSLKIIILKNEIKYPVSGICGYSVLVALNVIILYSYDNSTNHRKKRSLLQQQGY